jgi:hypothetical protein
MNNYVYTKSHLLEKYTLQTYSQDYFTNEVINDGQLVLEVDSVDVPDLMAKKLMGLSSCFVLEESSTLQLTRKKSIPCWRKLSEPLDKKLSPWTEVKEIQLTIESRHHVGHKTDTHFNKPQSQCSTYQSSRNNEEYPLTDNIVQLLIKKEENGQDNSHEFKINNLRHIKDNNKIEWYIYSDNYDFEFGPFKTDKLIEFYTQKLINQYTKIRLDPKYYEMITDGLKKSPIEHFVIKELCNVFSIKEKCSNKKPSFEEETCKPSNIGYKKKHSLDYTYGFSHDYYSYDYHAPKK